MYKVNPEDHGNRTSHFSSSELPLSLWIPPPPLTSASLLLLFSPFPFPSLASHYLPCCSLISKHGKPSPLLLHVPCSRDLCLERGPPTVQKKCDENQNINSSPGPSPPQGSAPIFYIQVLK